MEDAQQTMESVPSRGNSEFQGALSKHPHRTFRHAADLKLELRRTVRFYKEMLLSLLRAILGFAHWHKKNCPAVSQKADTWWKWVGRE